MTDHGRSVPMGRIVLGIVLLLAGVGWLLQALDVVDVPWQVALSASLVLVGAAILAVGRHGGLIAIGVTLTVILALASVLDVPFRGGVGERSYGPTSVTELREEYTLAVGQMTVDLSAMGTALAGRRIEASVGIGQLVVVVPAGAQVRVEGRAGAGEVVLFGRGHSGVNVEEVAGGPAPQADLEAAVGLGQVEVRRAP